MPDDIDSSVIPVTPPFRTTNFTGNEVLTSYALPFAKFYFDLVRTDTNLKFYSSKKIVWDYGDGTVVETVTGSHAYSMPGKYKVSCYLYDRQGKSYPGIVSQYVTVYDFLPSRLELTYSNQPNNLTLTAGKITNPITVTRYTSYLAYRSPNTKLTIVPFASGTTNNYFDLGYSSVRYSHLVPHSSFYFLTEGLKGLTEFVEISAFSTSSSNLYCRLVNNEIVKCTKGDDGAYFYGTSGTANVYFKSDIPLSNVVLTFGHPPGTIFNNTNTSYVSISNCSVVSNKPHSLSITSNGLDVEGTADTSFNINKNKFSNTKVGFVVKVKDVEKFSIKDLPILSTPNLHLTLTDGVTTYPAVFSSYFHPITATKGGFYKGYFKLNTNTTTSNVFISAYTTISGNLITGTSTTFTIYPSSSIYNIAKHGEDIDMTAKFKEISLQPLFLETPTLFNEFLGSVFGTISSDQTSVGKTTHEKIKNFVSNNSVIDYANIDSLVSILEEYNAASNIKFSTNNYRYPSALARLVDILSINKSRLFGSKNQFNQNFNTRGYINNDYYGTNLGDIISIYSTVTAGNDIVAFEKFSGSYKLLNTYQPISATGNTQYVLSAYNNNWGWGLVLPPNGYGNNLTNYYLFYKYVPGIEGTVEDSIINFNDSNNTLLYNISSYNDWSRQDGIISNLIARQIYEGLRLIN